MCECLEGRGFGDEGRKELEGKGMKKPGWTRRSGTEQCPRGHADSDRRKSAGRSTTAEEARRPKAGDVPSGRGLERGPADVEDLRDVEERSVLLRVVGDAVDVQAEHGGHDAVPLEDGEHGVARVGRGGDGAERVAEAHVWCVVPVCVRVENVEYT